MCLSGSQSSRLTEEESGAAGVRRHCGTSESISMIKENEE